MLGVLTLLAASRAHRRHQIARPGAGTATDFSGCARRARTELGGVSRAGTPTQLPFTAEVAAAQVAGTAWVAADSDSPTG